MRRPSLQIISAPLIILVFLSTNGIIGMSTTAQSTGSPHPDWYATQYKNTAFSPPVAAYPGTKALARDSYSDGHDASSMNDEPAIRYHYQMYPSDNSQHHGSGSSYGAPSTSYGWHGDDDDSYGNSAGGNGAVGLLGLLGLKGLKAAIPLLFPLLLPIILPFLLLLGAPFLLLLAIPLVLLLLFIPIPVVTVPQGRLGTTARELKELALAEDCIERISCEVTRYARNYGFNPSWVQEYLDKSAPLWMSRVSKGIQSSDCQKFSCNPSTVLKKSFKTDVKEEQEK